MVVTAAVLGVVVVVVGTSAGSVLLAAGRAQDAADAAALAAAHARDRGHSPRTAAAGAAAVHGATLVGCDCGRPPVTVTVRVAVAARPARLLGVTARTASASAELRSARWLPGLVGRAHRAVRSPHDHGPGGILAPT